MEQFLSALCDLYAPAGARRGQSLVEYALIIVLISIAVIGVMVLLSDQISGVFSRISTSMEKVK